MSRRSSNPPVGTAVLKMLALLVVTAAAFTVHAGSKQVAKQHFDDGKQHYENELYERAIEAFRASLAEYPTVSGYFNLANCQVASEKYSDAVDTLEEMEQTVGDGISPTMREETDALRQTIDERAARLRVTVTPYDATLFLNDTPLAVVEGQLLWLPPGSYRLRVEKEGFAPELKTMTLAKGALVELHLTMTAAGDTETDGPPTLSPVPPPPPQTVEESVPETVDHDDERTITPRSWIALGGTVALAVACGTFYGMAAKYAADHETYKENYEDDTLTWDEAQPWKTKETEADDKNALFQKLGLGFAIGAGAMAVTTTVLMLTDRARAKRSSSEELPVSLGPGNLIVRF